MGDVEITVVGYDDPVAVRLVRAALADLGERYGGEGDATPVDAAEFVPPEGAFLIAWRDGEAVGCGAWRSYDPTVAELKRMYTVPAARGTGVARSLLAAVEDSARSAGKSRAILECGDRQPEAIAMYQRYGYARIPNYGFYADAPGCVSFGRDL